MVESTEMKIFRDETSTKVLGAIMNAALSEHIDFRVTKWDILSNVISIIFRLCAVVFNGYLAYEYYNRGEIIFFRMTLCFIIVPAAVSVILSITL
jgi:XK-related protein